MAVCFFSLMCVAVHSGHTSLYYVNSVEGKRSGTARQDGLRITERGVPTAVTGVDSLQAANSPRKGRSESFRYGEHGEPLFRTPAIYL